MPINLPTALSPETWPFDLELLTPPVYLVGGAVRDALLGRRSHYFDLDFVMLTRAVKTARNIADRTKGGFVLLDAERQIARVVFAGGTADFAEALGGSLEGDLLRRDFRINAIACNPFTGEIIDPLDGQTDLRLGLLRMISRSNLEDDPLRLLRAYRQAAQLGFAIEPETQSAIRELAPLLSRVAVERVRTELGYLLSNHNGIPWICRGCEDGLFSIWFASAIDRFDILTKIDSCAADLAAIYPDLGREFGRSIRDTIKTPLLAVGKLAILANSDPTIAETELLRLKYSNAEIKSAIGLLKYLPKLQAKPIAEMSLRKQYFLFRDVGIVFPVLAVLALAAGVAVDDISLLINRYLNADDIIAHPTQLVSGNELMESLKIPRSPLIGQLLMEIQLARVEGRIATREEALKLAADLIEVD
ncbi:CCA tRNA nucleotidyltransferase [Tychonema sp. LEGE 07199]|uniref:CCA tRNA nucleotidyltransferase n=1 Tax=unclassified Tychonema TaxID=2642144 RepID=UPI0018807DA6|nr:MULTISPECIES: CCA tRNA nucleotidyltransferase [unclassified Tychonema]MBE9123395.1 CCA tRNA nucleotidyltransferase [Tychonema sp. LEGE 07199]MBE9132002.1 CCA tRNA nucleotidyltransferase [Tychonema sp. LEGE 07196]